MKRLKDETDGSGHGCPLALVHRKLNRTTPHYVANQGRRRSEEGGRRMEKEEGRKGEGRVERPFDQHVGFLNFSKSELFIFQQTNHFCKMFH